jgi:hypothetical protein
MILRVTGYLLGSLVLGSLLLSGLTACSSSTDPGNGGVGKVVYIPDRQFLDVVVPNTADFSVSSSGTGTVQATWVLNGQEVGSAPTFQYQSGAVGLDTLTVRTVLNGETRERVWLITVLSSPSLLPPPVPGVQILDGNAPMDVVVNWLWIAQSAFPVVEYLVAGSYEGPVTVDNWEEADLLGTFPHVPGQAGYTALFTAEEHGMLPAETLHVGLRARDDRGQLSTIAEFYQHTISFAWYVEGIVTDEYGTPLQEIIIDYDCPSCRVNTDVNGFYRIGPFLDSEAVNIYTASSNALGTGWYDFAPRPFTYDPLDTTNDLMLLTRSGMDELCTTYSNEFLAFLRTMTRTDVTTAQRHDYSLYKWEEYPVKVYIPDHVRESDQLDFGANARVTLDYWNQAMGEDYLVEVSDEGAAQIRFTFEDLGTGVNGQTLLNQPSEPVVFVLGDVIPELVQVRINTLILPNAQRIQETSLHELGHALGLYAHVSGCSDRPYLMNVTSAGVLDDGPEGAIHSDEVRLLHAIRYLPQGVNMDGFRLDGGR